MYNIRLSSTLSQRPFKPLGIDSEFITAGLLEKNVSPAALSLGQIKLKRRGRHGDGNGGDGVRDPPTRILRRLRRGYTAKLY